MTTQFTKRFSLCGGKFRPREGRSFPSGADEIHLQVVAPEGQEYQPTLKETIRIIADDRGEFVNVLAGDPPKTIFKWEGREFKKPWLFRITNDTR